MLFELGDGRRPLLFLDIVGEVSDGQLEFTWYFHPDECAQATVEPIAGEFAAALRGIAQDCREAA